MSILTVTLLGADGNLGPKVFQGLTSAGFNVTVLKRASSKSPSTYPQEKRVPDDFPLDAVAEALKGQDAVIVTIKGTEVGIQKRLADACVEAGVRRFIPADFGSCDSSSPLTMELLPLYRAKTEVREYLQVLAASHPSFTWTSIVCGHFFDWSPEFLHVWIPRRRAEILDDGETKFSVSTLSRIADSTARALQRAEVTKNRMIYVQSFCVSQKQIIDAYEKATGSKWEVKAFQSEAFRDEQRKKADAGDKAAVEEVVWYLGTVDANWETRSNLAMQELGLEDENLDVEVRKVVAEVENR